MLQQTQVATVIPYFQRFTKALPSLSALAAASEDQVLSLWAGLGYYRRARFLHAAAQVCQEHYAGELPPDFAALLALPGIGRSTAGAILSQAYALPYPILDGNVKRVLCRYHGIHGQPALREVEKKLWTLATAHTPTSRNPDYSQAIMDLGAAVCSRSQPHCTDCPLQTDCIAYQQGLTTQLPSPRPSKRLPTRHTAMLLLRDGKGRVLLQRRGPQGVWPGLWSLPEAADGAAARCEANRHAETPEALALAGFEHVFSHYRLCIEPWLFDRAHPRPQIADQPDWRWCDMSEQAELGMPAPVRYLLTTLQESLQ
ncbi:dna glycosylase [Lasius niger]|uniref:Adenine DNA glycosylase n=1 Tax=Lasius niger TaxID=67767 RepID=A0A0J7KCW4_LASNI|nr:dna glycosylase [Lasius niger]